MFITKVTLMAVATGITALSVAMCPVQDAYGSSPPQAKPTETPTTPVDRAARDAQKDVDKALTQYVTFPANIGMPEIGEARLKALLAKADEKMKTLLKGQYEAALVETRGRWLEFKSGRGLLYFLLYSSGRLLEAECDLSDQKADHVAAIEHHLQRLRAIERVNNQRFQASRIAIKDVAQTHFDRVRAEIRLERARRDLAKEGR